MSNWFKRIKEGITTSTTDKKETPEGLWYKCPKCKNIMTSNDHADHCYVCSSCAFHERINSKEYFDILFDEQDFEELDAELESGDVLHFEDTKKYTDRLRDTQKKSGLKDACRTAHGMLDGLEVVVTCMDFTFIGGSMGSVVGEKISRAIDFCAENNLPFIMISKSGGARMMESAFSLMQMAKTSAKLTLLSAKKIPYISLMTDPTTGGVTASFAMLGDLNVSEPGALIGFAGPRVVRETIGKDLPKGFQTAEFVLEHGFLDKIINRRELKVTFASFIRFLT